MLIGTTAEGNWIFPWYFPLFWVLPLALFFFVWFLLWRFASRRRYWGGAFYCNRGLSDGSHIEVLKLRLAEGDIDEEQYDRLAKKLGGGKVE